MRASNRKSARAALRLAAFSATALLLIASFGCAPAASPGDNQSSESASNDLPEITDEMIHERINDARVRQVPEENGVAEPIIWNFDEDEPKEIQIVEKQLEGERAAIVLDITTQSATNARQQRRLAGQIRTKWRLRTGWVLRKWELIETENISMKYQNLSQPPAQNSDR